MIKLIKINQLQNKIGYNFFRHELLLQALTHRSAGINNNERLEFLGDSILNYVITTDLYKRFPDLDEGSMSNIRANLIKSATLLEIANELQISEYLLLGTGEFKNGGSFKKSILANAIEALIGGIFLDSNINIIERLILDWYYVRLNNIIPENQQKDFKTRLQEYLQEYRYPLPNYSVIKISGAKHKQKFTVSCYIKNLKFPVIGNGNSKRQAEQNAAEKVIKLLEI